MKTKHFLTGLAILSMAFVVGCQKDDTTPSATEVSSQMSLEESKLKSLVTNFSNKINSEFKSSEIMSIDSAEWYIEATLNYTYSNSVPYESYVIDSVKYVINDNGNSSAIISDIADAYNHILTGLSTKFYSMTEENKAFDFINVESRVMTDGNVELIGHYQIGTNPGNSLNKSSMTAVQKTFGPTDYWKPYGGGGKCGPYEGQCIGRDATTELTRVCGNIHNLTYQDSEQSRMVWSGLKEFYMVNSTFDGAYNLWVGDDTEAGFPMDCIDPDRMNYYLLVIKYILRERIPMNNSCKAIEVYETHPVGLSKFCPMHFVRCNYGMATILQTTPTTLPIIPPNIGAGIVF